MIQSEESQYSIIEDTDVAIRLAYTWSPLIVQSVEAIGSFLIFASQIKMLRKALQ